MSLTRLYNADLQSSRYEPGDFLDDTRLVAAVVDLHYLANRRIGIDIRCRCRLLIISVAVTGEVDDALDPAVAVAARLALVAGAVTCGCSADVGSIEDVLDGAPENVQRGLTLTRGLTRQVEAHAAVVLAIILEFFFF